MCARERVFTVYLLYWLVFACIVESAVPKLAKLAGNEYVGCYRDQEDPRLLRGAIYFSLETMTPQVCVNICKPKGYIYAGVETGSQCLCGDEDLPASAKLGDDECSERCTGDKSAICGGTWKITIYKTGNSELSLPKLATLPGNEYVGCYKDQTERLLGYLQDHSNLTPQICVTTCKSKGYTYAGVEGLVQCFCGDEVLPASAKVADHECSGRCIGDLSAICGGTWRITIYKTGNSESTVPKLTKLAGNEYVGCYRDQEDPRLLRGAIYFSLQTMTPQLCITICKPKGYIYAGVEAGSQCLCGDEDLSASAKLGDHDCSERCTGDKSAICGGTWRITIYKTGNSESSLPKLANLPGNEYVGCYKDQAERLLGFLHDHSNLTPQICVTTCKSKGYTYAGVEGLVQCFCGDGELPASAKVSDHECSGRCMGDLSAICGGTWRITIYKTGNSGASVADIGYQYMGCHRDENHQRKLSGYMTEYPETLTPQYCVTVCKQKNFLFAGLQNGLQCFCGNEFPSFKDKVPESECNSKCSGELTAICGAALRNTIYTTANKIDSTIQNECITSVTKVNGKAACQNEVVFEDHFNSLSLQNWSHVIEIPNEPDYQFVIFNSDPANSYTADGKLVIKPTLLPDSEVRSGDLHLEKNMA